MKGQEADDEDEKSSGSNESISDKDDDANDSGHENTELDSGLMRK